MFHHHTKPNYTTREAGDESTPQSRSLTETELAHIVGGGDGGPTGAGDRNG